MTNAADLIKTAPIRILDVGYPGSGKTGGLACLMNAGYKMRVLAFDKIGNMTPLLQYTKPEFLPNLDILLFEDKLRAGQKFIEPLGIPTSFADALKAMDHWAYTEGDVETDLGHSKEWGPDTIVVLDSLTAMGDAAMRRARNMMNKTPLTTTDGTWGFAMSEQEAFIEKLCGNSNKFHVIVNAHLKMVAPRDERKGDSDVTKQIKEDIAEILPTRLYPSALGRALPQNIHRHFPTMLLFESIHVAGKMKRVIRNVPRPELDLKLPAVDIPDNLPIDDGLLTIFKALGRAGPGL